MFYGCFLQCCDLQQVAAESSCCHRRLKFYTHHPKTIMYTPDQYQKSCSQQFPVTTNLPQIGTNIAAFCSITQRNLMVIVVNLKVLLLSFQLRYRNALYHLVQGRPLYGPRLPCLKHIIIELNQGCLSLIKVKQACHHASMSSCQHVILPACHHASMPLLKYVIMQAYH